MGAARQRTPEPAEVPRRGSPTLAPAGPPPPDPLVPLHRIDPFFDAVPATPVSLVVAPAGTGKTAAVAAWSERVRRSGAATAIWARPDRRGDLERALAATRSAEGPPAVVVVDDAHRLPAAAAELLAADLAADPDALRLLLVGRDDPGLVPTSLVLAGGVRRLRPDDLRLTDAEAAELVLAHCPDAGPEAVAAVVEHTEGWAALVVLAGRALAARGPTADVRGTLLGARPMLHGYLAREVVDALPEDVARVLLTTCDRSRVSSGTAALLSGLPDAAELLARTAATGFLVRSDREVAGEPAWRYHPVLRDLLRRRTDPDGPDRTVAVDAHRRAARHFLDRGEGQLAIHHAGLSGDLDLQLGVLRELAPDLIGSGRVDLVEAALAQIPVEIRLQHQELLVLQAVAFRSRGQVDTAKVATDRALAAAAGGADPDTLRGVEAQLAALELWQARFGWRAAASATARAHRVLGCRHDREEQVASHDLSGVPPATAAWLLMELATFETWLGELTSAAVHLQLVSMYVDRVDQPLLRRAVLGHHAVLDMVLGSHQNAIDWADAALALEPAGRPDVFSARAHLARGWAELQSLRVEEAAASLAAFDRTPRAELDPLLLVYGRLLRACVLMGTGEVEAARRLMDGRGEVPERVPFYLERLDRLVRLIAGATMGDLPAIVEEVGRLRRAGMTPAATLGSALVSGLGGDEQRAVRMLDDLLAGDSVPAPVAGMAATARVAFLHRAGTQDAVARAHQLVPDLLSRAATQRLNWMLSFGTVISPRFTDLLAQHAEGSSAHPYAATAVAALRGYARPYPDQTPHRADAVRPDVPGTGTVEEARSLLTPRELEVLEHLSLGGGNADLARSLFVSENTVKTHLASIYRKLGVERRVDALRIARARGLL